MTDMKTVLQNIENSCCTTRQFLNTSRQFFGLDRAKDLDLRLCCTQREAVSKISNQMEGDGYADGQALLCA